GSSRRPAAGPLRHRAALPPRPARRGRRRGGAGARHPRARRPAAGSPGGAAADRRLPRGRRGQRGGRCGPGPAVDRPRRGRSDRPAGPRGPGDRSAGDRGRGGRRGLRRRRGVPAALRGGLRAHLLRRPGNAGQRDGALRHGLRQRLLGRHPAGLRRRGRARLRAVHQAGRRAGARAHPCRDRAHRGAALPGSVGGAQRVDVRRLRLDAQAAPAGPERRGGRLAHRCGTVPARDQ
ncbi:MAG: putative metalloprotease, partial [uncultured Nocardioidaceae bacterium]